MQVLLDTNILLDFLLEREPFFRDVEQLFHALELNQTTGYVTATTLTDIFYIVRRQTQSINTARQAIADLLITMEICSVDRAVVDYAFHSGLTDFEDAIQIASGCIPVVQIVHRD